MLSSSSRVYPGKSETTVYRYLYCTHYYHRPRTCSHHVMVKQEPVVKWVDDLIREAVQRGVLVVDVAPPPNYAAQIEAIHGEIRQVEDQLDSLIILQSKGSIAAASHYQARIDHLAEHLDILIHQEQELEHRQLEIDSQSDGEREAIAQIARAKDKFWELPGAEINQILHRLFGDRRIAVNEEGIVGIQ